MDDVDNMVDTQDSLDKAFDDGPPVDPEAENELASDEHEWIGKDLVHGVEMGVITADGNHDIDLIHTSAAMPFDHDGGNMLGAIRSSSMDNTLQQHNDSRIQEGHVEQDVPLDNVAILQSENQHDMLIGANVENKEPCASITNDLQAFGPGSGYDSRVQQDLRNSSRVAKPGSKAFLNQESRDEARFYQPTEQTLSPGQTEENCHSDLALSQDTGDGTEGFYPTNPDCGNMSSYFLSPHSVEDTDGTEEEQYAFMKELENFFRDRNLDFKPPKFYGENLNCLKLWRAVTRLGGYDTVTACKLWRQVGESFKPPKTCTTVSWSFRGFYEKALLDYERAKFPNDSGHGNGSNGNGTVAVGSTIMPTNSQNYGPPLNWTPAEAHAQVSGSGRARRDAAARAMQGWHSQRILGNGEVSDPIVKDKSNVSLGKREKQLKNTGLKRKKPPGLERPIKVSRAKGGNSQSDTMVIDVGPQADWVKINVHKTRDCFEVYALVPGLLREEVRVQCDPAGRLVISGNPDQPENPWGVTPFKKVITLPSRIDSHQTSAVVTLHGQLFVRVPFEQVE